MPSERSWGRLKNYQSLQDRLDSRFQDAYWKRVEEQPYSGALPLSQPWQMSIVEAKTMMVLITRRAQVTGPFVGTFIPFNRELFKIPETMEEPAALRDFLNLGELIDARQLPIQVPPPSEGDGPDARERWDKYRVEIADWSMEWGRSLAERHIQEANPTFQRAKARMTSAYDALFEIERGLRAVVEDSLSGKEALGPDWYQFMMKKFKGIADAVQDVKEQEAKNVKRGIQFVDKDPS